MSIDQRLRNGLHPADPDHGLDTLAALRRVEQRATRRTRTTRVAVGALVAATLVAVIGVGAALQQGRPDRADVVATQPSEQLLIGTYVVDVPDSSVARRDGLVGRWVISLEADGALELRPPTSYTGATTGAAWRVEDELLRTDALVEPGCQADSGYVGTYRWSLTDDLLAFSRRRRRVRRTPCAVHRLRLGAGALTRAAHHEGSSSRRAPIARSAGLTPSRTAFMVSG